MELITMACSSVSCLFNFAAYIIGEDDEEEDDEEDYDEDEDEDEDYEDEDYEDDDDYVELKASIDTLTVEVQNIATQLEHLVEIFSGDLPSQPAEPIRINPNRYRPDSTANSQATLDQIRESGGNILDKR